MGTDERPRAVLVTGASRGIGKEIALALASAGHDVALTARAVSGGLPYGGSSTTDDLAGVVLPGSVDEVAEKCRTFGVRAVPIAMDLTDPASIESAANTAIDALGHIDTFVANAIYQGPGINDRFEELSISLLRTVIEADAIGPMISLKVLMSSMVASGRGLFINVTSGTATLVPRAPVGEGGWGIAYAMAKGSAHRIAGVLNAEYADRGVRAYNLNPGHVTTDAMRERAKRMGVEPTGQSAEIPAKAAAWIVAGSPDAVALAGKEVVARDVVTTFNL
jgi:NAD(P)-dependent dehydrogenase (short-subunit alcohol dehydrogenase family)